ncbi:MAG: hypothetical protein EOO65_03090 [Methanosarcinales archaeon]|nr:MAG: hypothetical protein EOO65_03090 [Methanosarcinales archaeon]
MGCPTSKRISDLIFEAAESAKLESEVRRKNRIRKPHKKAVNWDQGYMAGTSVGAAIARKNYDNMVKAYIRDKEVERRKIEESRQRSANKRAG